MGISGRLSGLYALPTSAVVVTRDWPTSLTHHRVELQRTTPSVGTSVSPGPRLLIYFSVGT